MTDKSDENRETIVKFVNLLRKFSDGMASCYAENDQITQTSNRLRVLCQTDWGINKIVENWFKYLTTPLPDTKYKKPLERLLQSVESEYPHAVIYHAYQYNDIATAGSEANPLQDFIDLNHILSDPSFDAESRDATFKYMKALNNLVFEIKKRKVPPCPTRDEIANEIDSFRKQAKQTADEPAKYSIQNTTTDLIMSLSNICREQGVVFDKDLYNEIAEKQDDGRDWIVDWHDAMQTCIDGKTLYELFSREEYATFCRAEEVQFLNSLGIFELIKLSDNEYREETVEIIGKINILSQVHGSVPVNMRHKIEETAQKLASQILSGNVDLASIDIGQIGNDVLEGCDPSDLTELANKVGSLLPELANSVNIDPNMLLSGGGGAEMLQIMNGNRPQ